MNTLKQEKSNAFAKEIAFEHPTELDNVGMMY